MAWFYPDTKPPEYVYTSAFASNDTVTAASGREYSVHGGWAEQVVAKQKNMAGVAISEKGRGGAAIVELNRMINMARAAEQQFLIAHGLKNPGNNWNKLITEINKILSTEQAFKRNVQLLKQFDENKDSKNRHYEDVSVYFREKLQKAIYKHLEIDINATGYEILQRAVIQAVKEMADITDTKEKNGKIITQRTNDEQKALKAFADLFGVIEVIEGSEFLLKISEIFGLADYIEQVRNYLVFQDSTKVPKLTYKGSKTNKGTLAEILYTAVAKGIGNGGNDTIQWTTVEHTGSANYKPDRVLATMEVSYNQSVDTVRNNGINYGTSVRARGIATMEQLYMDLADAKGDIVLISDKNYLINNAFVEGTDKKLGGFGAQGETSLTALDMLLSSLHINVFNIDALINYLANIGNNLIETDVDNRILRALSAQVGNFLFDDLSFNESAIPGGVNVIHVFQLSGIYVPLSIILEGVKNGIGNLQNTDLSSYVEIKFNASGDEPESWGKNAGAEVFEQFRNTKMKNNTLSINFLRDFASIIANSVKL